MILLACDVYGCGGDAVVSEKPMLGGMPPGWAQVETWEVVVRRHLAAGHRDDASDDRRRLVHAPWVSQDRAGNWWAGATEGHQAVLFSIPPTCAVCLEQATVDAAEEAMHGDGD